MSDLREAMIRLDQRKEAVTADNPKSPLMGASVVGAEQLRRLLVGLDLDMDEIEGTAARLAVGATVAMLDTGTDALNMIGSTWLDGLLTGLLMAEIRKERDE